MSMKVIRRDEAGNIILQGSEAWKQLRAGLVTGTMAADIAARQKRDPTKYMAARATALTEIVTEMLTGKPSGSSGTTSYMKDGVEREPYARMAYEEITGRVVEEVAFVRHSWMAAGVSPDGLCIGEPRTVEIKSPKDTTHLEYLQLATCPEDYVYQVQMGLWICEAQYCDFVSYHPEFPPEMQVRIIEIPRNEALIATIEKEVGLFLAEAKIKVQSIRELVAQRATAQVLQAAANTAREYA